MYKIIITFIFFIIIPLQVLADQNDDRLNYLFDKLVIEEDEQAINKITNQIWKIWHEIDDPKMTGAFETGIQMMNLGGGFYINFFIKKSWFPINNKTIDRGNKLFKKYGK